MVYNTRVEPNGIAKTATTNKIESLAELKRRVWRFKKIVWRENQRRLTTRRTRGRDKLATTQIATVIKSILQESISNKKHNSSFQKKTSQPAVKSESLDPAGNIAIFTSIVYGWNGARTEFTEDMEVQHDMEESRFYPIYLQKLEKKKRRTVIQVSNDNMSNHRTS